MLLFENKDYKNAEPLLDSLISKGNLPPDPLAYAWIAKAVIVCSKPNRGWPDDFLAPIVEKFEGNPETKKDLLLTESRLLRWSDKPNLAGSFKVAGNAFREFPDDPAILLNYSVICLSYSSVVKFKKAEGWENDCANILKDAETAALKITNNPAWKTYYPQAFNSLGRVYLNQGKFSEAAEKFEKAVTAEPKPNFINNLGMAQLKIAENLGFGQQKLDFYNLSLSNLEKAKGLDSSLKSSSQIPGMMKNIQQLEKALKEKNKVNPNPSSKPTN